LARNTKAAGTLAGRYFDQLAEEGYRPKLEQTEDRTSTVAFKAEGLTFVLLVDETDEDFLGLGLSYALGEVDPVAAGNRAHELNDQFKVVKVCVDSQDRSVRFMVEVFLEAPATMRLLGRAMSALRNAAKAFFEPARPVEHLDA
jgi:hypothetical protein